MVATIDVGAHACAGILAAYDAVWVPSCEEGALYRIDPGTDEASPVLEIPVFKSTGALTTDLDAGSGSIWMVTEGESAAFDSLARIDPETNEIAATIQIDENPGQASDIAMGDGFVYVRTQYTLLAKIDPARNAIVERYTDPKGSRRRGGRLRVGLALRLRLQQRVAGAGLRAHPAARSGRLAKIRTNWRNPRESSSSTTTR